MNVDLGDVTLHVRDQGSGSPVVLLHGWPDTGDLWRHQVSALAAAGYRVITPDLRGFGGSGKPADLAAYTAPVLIGDDFRNLREWSAHPDIEPVIERLADPAALTASLSLYRAILSPESLVQPPTPLPPVTVPPMGVWSSGDFALVEEGMTGSARYMTGPWRYERIDGAGHWLQLDAPDRGNALLLDFLGQQGESAAPHSMVTSENS